MDTSNTFILAGATAVLTIFGRELVRMAAEKVLTKKEETSNGHASDKFVGFWKEEIAEITAASVRSELERGVVPVLQDIRDGIYKLIVVQEERTRGRN